MHDLDAFILKHFNVTPAESGPTVLPIDRYGLPRLWRKFGALTVAEIGVSKGRFTREICKIMPSAKVYGIDPWSAYDEYVERKGHRGQQALSRHYEEAKARLAPFQNCELIKAMSLDAAATFADNSLDAIFIDANHSFAHCIADIAAWTPKVKPGGMITGHDYWNSADGFGYLRLPIKQFIKNLTDVEERQVCQVKYAVDAWVAAQGIDVWYLSGSDDCSSWAWIKR
jgi:hypothetical protein